MPFEKSRPGVNVYEPTNALNSRYIEQYGGYTQESLWDGIVPFPAENYYYVPYDHVVMNVIRQNWETLAINADLEQRRESKYLKVSSEVCKSVINALSSDVLDRLPFTEMNNLAARFQTKSAVDYDQTQMDGPEQVFHVSTEISIKYMYPTVRSVC